MSNVANSSLTLTASVNGSLTQISSSAQFTMAGGNAALLTMTVTTTPTAIPIGAAATIGKIAIKVLTGSGTQHVVVSLDNAGPPTQVVSDIPEGEGILLVKPPATLYASVNTGTIQIQYGVAER